MTSRNATMVVLVAIGASVAAAFADQAAAPPVRDGKAIFLESKCNTCHTVTALKIEKKKGAEEESEGKVKPPDLSSVGLERKARQAGATWYAIKPAPTRDLERVIEALLRP